ncbi:PTS glucitol/sorbitol transporter subunit IIA [Streptomyces caeruleatus]|uniref:PTS sorbitol transporter subunit IIA n=1 Tax=Streptomyces caeruleatus TaxID=661399 RepID=A0A101U882_9ACTN|nr:PTS glucitol/sorbitol transporter subunit IIA [Streptomyces caeruleatus]KUO06043.1 PTS sorbitol transporter subunit IIA [Streptomyces caeruleatus]
MSNVYYKSTVRRVGATCEELLDGGVLILCSAPVPEALQDASVVHEPSVPLTGELRCGDRLWLDGRLIELVAVGERATRNLRELGHVVVHVNAADTQVPPGAVYGRGTLTLPETGAPLALAAGVPSRHRT